MTDRETIQKLIADQTLESVLRRGSRSKDAIRALQNLLHELGFGAVLNWDKYGADGFYGDSSVAAVKAFAERNDLSGNGEMVTKAIAVTLLARFEILDDLRHLYNAVQENKVEQLFYKGSPHSTAVVVLQTLLHELGFDVELNWERYGADGDYGGSTARAVEAFAERNGMRSDGTQLTKELARKIIDRFKNYYGDDWARDGQISVKLSIRETIEGGRTRVYISDGTVEKKFTRYKNGLYTVGDQKVIDFVNTERASLSSLGLTDSAINIMVAVSENEGNLDAVNTWDNSFMTFGMFQWTIGTGDNPGELPALLKKIKEGHPEVFQKYFGRHGLDVIDTDGIRGYLTLNGKKLAGSSDKESLRTYDWAFYFRLSGQDPVVKTVQIQHALSRIDTFYKSDQYKVNGHYIADLVTSEYGVGLVLDNHVNRPGYIKGCLQEAMNRVRLPADPKEWGTAEECRLIDAYLSIRETYGSTPMTDARKRAEVTKKYLTDGAISDERGSFNTEYRPGDSERVPSTSGKRYSGRVLQKGSRGEEVQEIQICLAGFGGTVPDGIFGSGTELQVIQFQRDFMKMTTPTGIIDDKTFHAIETFAKKYPIDFNALRCPCNVCNGFGQGRFKGRYRSGKPRLEMYHEYEYPGMHRMLLWAVRAVFFYMPQYEFVINSGYRCGVRNEQTGRSSTNHMGKAVDLDVPLKQGEDRRTDMQRCDEIRRKIVEVSKAQIGWADQNKKALEPPNIAPTWVHYDVRTYEPQYLEDKFFCKSLEELDNICFLTS